MLYLQRKPSGFICRYEDTSGVLNIDPQTTAEMTEVVSNLFPRAFQVYLRFYYIIFSSTFFTTVQEPDQRDVAFASRHDTFRAEYQHGATQKADSDLC